MGAWLLELGTVPGPTVGQKGRSVTGLRWKCWGESPLPQALAREAGEGSRACAVHSVPSEGSSFHAGPGGLAGVSSLARECPSSLRRPRV